MAKQKKSKKLTKRVQRPRLRKVSNNDGVELHLHHYSITYEPLENSNIPPDIEDEVGELFDMAQERPNKAIPRLEVLIEQYPDIPQLLNYLSVAYGFAGKKKKAEETAKLNYEKNPDYLFAKLNYAEICLSKGEISKIPVIFENKFDLQALYPERNEFHIAEFAYFFYMTGLYFLAIENKAQAEICLQVLVKASPDHPTTKRLKAKLESKSLIERMYRLLSKQSDSA